MDPDLHKQDYRLSHIYKIRDKLGEIVTFKPNRVQKELFDNLHTRNVIPKARQHGITTAVSIYFLDQCLWKSDQRAAIIAHRETDALKIFETKIKFPYLSLDPMIKKLLAESVKMTSDVLELDNGSVLTADTMVRSDTLNWLHVSELGKMSAWYPIKAEEVKTGAFPAAEKGTICVESTMEGASGLMADLCTSSLKARDSGELTEKDFKFFFFPWWKNDDYRLKKDVVLTKQDLDYFYSLKTDHDIDLTHHQKAWYVKEREIQGERMRQEYPSTYEETIQASVEGSFFARQIDKARYEKRICHVPYDSHLRAYASMDIGRNDSTAIWIFQVLRKEIRFIDYYEMNGENLPHYADWMLGLPYSISRVFLPHDAGAKSQQTGRTYDDLLREDFGFKTKVFKRDAHEYLAIDVAVNILPRCWIDYSKCSRGVECLTLFKKEFNRKYNIYTKKSVHDEYSDGAKSFIYAAKGVKYLENSSDDEFKPGELSRMKQRPSF